MSCGSAGVMTRSSASSTGPGPEVTADEVAPVVSLREAIARLAAHGQRHPLLPARAAACRRVFRLD